MNFATSTVSQKTKQRGRLMGVSYIALIGSWSFIHTAGMPIRGILYYTHTWGFQRCSFRLTGQCEGLQNVERVTGVAPRSLFLYDS